MAQGSFCSLLIGTILTTLGTQFGILLTAQVITINDAPIPSALCSFMSGSAMAVAIGHASRRPPMVLFLPGDGGLCLQCSRAARRPAGGAICSHHRRGVRKGCQQERFVDICDPYRHHPRRDRRLPGHRPPIGGAADAGQLISEDHPAPALLDNLVSVLVGIVDLPISSAAICSVLA